MSVSLQKANFWKRFSAYLFDTVCVICVAMALVLLFSVVFQTDKYTNEYNAYRAEYAEKYEINLKLTKEEYDELCESHSKLCALEAWGVDNWEGYDDAMSHMDD